MGNVSCLLIMALLCSGHPVQKCLPPIESDELREILEDDWTLFYDSKTMPRITMDGSRVVSQDYRFNFDGNQTNPSDEYPWKIGGGLHSVNSRDVAIVKFYWHKEHKPVRYHESRRRNGFANRVIDQTYDWKFPIGSVLGEIIALRRPDGTYPIEIRTLTRDSDAWQPSVYRQVNQLFDLADRLWEFGYEDAAYAVGRTPLTKKSLRDPIHSPPAIEREYTEAVLPRLPDDAVRKLLDEPLVEVVYASELTATESQILPANYKPAQVGIDREDCRQCHRHVGVHAQFLDAPGRDWYGHLSGSGKSPGGEGIFSFHPFDRSAINSRGSEGRPVIFSRELTASGHVAPYRGEAGY